MLELKTYKNWKEICEVMEWKTTGGTYKKARLKELESMCNYHKDGNKFIIEEIYEEKRFIEDGRMNGRYTDDIQEALLYVLYNIKKSKGVVDMSLNEILKSIEMVNINYQKCRSSMDKLAEELKMDESYIRDFYDNNHKSLRQKIETALNSLYKRKLVAWNKVIMINVTETTMLTNRFGTVKIDEETDKPIYVSENITRKATDEETKVILHIEKQALNIFNCKNCGEIIARGLWNNYNEYIRKELDGTGVKYYFNAYHLVFNHCDIAEEVVGDIGYINTIKNLNKNITECISKGAETRHNNAIKRKTIGKNKKENYNIAIEEDYVENNNILINKLIVTK